jgi:hypothetical protein
MAIANVQARPGVVAARSVAVLALALLLTSCSRFGFKAASCREPAVPVQPANNPSLKVAPGLDLPDTRNAVKVPELNEPEKPRGKDAPCLSRPPAYGGG